MAAKSSELKSGEQKSADNEGRPIVHVLEAAGTGVRARPGARAPSASRVGEIRAPPRVRSSSASVQTTNGKTVRVPIAARYAVADSETRAPKSEPSAAHAADTRLPSSAAVPTTRAPTFMPKGNSSDAYKQVLTTSGLPAVSHKPLSVIVKNPADMLLRTDLSFVCAADPRAFLDEAFERPLEGRGGNLSSATPFTLVTTRAVDTTPLKGKTIVFVLVHKLDTDPVVTVLANCSYAIVDLEKILTTEIVLDTARGRQLSKAMHSQIPTFDPDCIVQLIIEKSLECVLSGALRVAVVCQHGLLPPSFHVPWFKAGLADHPPLIVISSIDAEKCSRKYIRAMPTGNVVSITSDALQVVSQMEQVLKWNDQKVMDEGGRVGLRNIKRAASLPRQEKGEQRMPLDNTMRIGKDLTESDTKN